VTLLLKACDILLMRPKFITVNRVTAFAKRLSLYSAHQPPHIAMALMGFIRQLSQKRSYLADLISESPEDNAGNAEYNPNAQEPEFAQADGAIMWEWCLLTKSYHPTLSRYTLAVQKMAQEVRDPLMKRPASLTHAVMEGLGPMLRSDGGGALEESRCVARRFHTRNSGAEGEEAPYAADVRGLCGAFVCACVVLCSRRAPW